MGAKPVGVSITKHSNVKTGSLGSIPRHNIMVKADHGHRSWVGGETPFWERKRYVLNKAARENRQKEIDAMNEHFRIKGKRPPLTEEQKLCGARRVI